MVQKLKTPFGMAIFLLVLVMGQTSITSGFQVRNAKLGILGGPEIQKSASNPRFFLAALAAADTQYDALQENTQVKDVSLWGLKNEGGMGVTFENKQKIFSHYAEKGETTDKIAARFGVSRQTLALTNPGLKRGLVRQGRAVLIPQKAADRVISGNEIASYDGANEIRDVGTLPNLGAYFGRPAEGFNWGKLHDFNAVDIVNSCGVPVVSAAAGMVALDEHLGDGSNGWNNGYGRFVLIEHPNGTKTRYAHLESISVSVGDIMKKGQQLGLMGKSGDATECHVHFEIYGAKNPFVK